MTNKEKFLRENVGFHFEDLSLIKQAELNAITASLGLSLDWVLLALSRDSLENWEKWGFNLFRKAEFHKEIDGLLAALDKMEESQFKKENSRKRKNGKHIYVSEKTFKYCYDGVMKQGRLLTQEQAQALNLDGYWTYGYSLKPEDYDWINIIISSKGDVDEEDWLQFCLSVQYVDLISGFKF